MSLTPLSLQVEHCPSRIGMLAFIACSLRECSFLYCFSQHIPLWQNFSMSQWKERGVLAPVVVSFFILNESESYLGVMG